jgi:transmembrane sensor
MSYEDFSAEDFLMDASFKKWLLDPDPATIYFWESWLTKNPDKRNTVEEAIEIFKLIHFQEYPFTANDSRQVWDNILAKRQGIPHPKATPIGKIYALNNKRLGYMARIAAGLIFILVAGITLYFISGYRQEIQYLTKYGEKREILLPDSSVVVLNGNSSLIIRPRWNQGPPREVWLEGEAFFHIRKRAAIAKQQRKPGEMIKFTVHTNNLDVMVLGTAFNVNDRKGITKVMLQKGQVKLSLKEGLSGRELMMEPEDMVEVWGLKRKVSKRKVNPELYASWTKDKLIVDNTPLAEVAAILEDSFGYEVIFKDQAHAQRLVRGTLPLNEINILLEALANSLDLQVSKEGKRIIFEDKKQ